MRKVVWLEKPATRDCVSAGTWKLPLLSHPVRTYDVPVGDVGVRPRRGGHRVPHAAAGEGVLRPAVHVAALEHAQVAGRRIRVAVVDGIGLHPDLQAVDGLLDARVLGLVTLTDEHRHGDGRQDPDDDHDDEQFDEREPLRIPAWCPSRRLPTRPARLTGLTSQVCPRSAAAVWDICPEGYEADASDSSGASARLLYAARDSDSESVTAALSYHGTITARASVCPRICRLTNAGVASSSTASESTSSACTAMK